jgi:hypothetical protein
LKQYLLSKNGGVFCFSGSIFFLLKTIFHSHFPLRGCFFLKLLAVYASLCEYAGLAGMIAVLINS